MRKKHYTQLTKGERKLIEEIRNEMKIRKFSDHAKMRMKQKYTLKFFEFEDFKDVMVTGKVIEVSDYGNGDVRIVFASRKPKLGETLAFSFSIKNRIVVTAWTNNAEDNHETIDLSEYDPKMNAYKALKKAYEMAKRKEKKIRKKKEKKQQQ